MDLPTVLILAAGASSRMRGGDKLLERVEGEPLIRRVVCAALATGAPVLVALPPDRPERDAAVQEFHLARVTVVDAGTGLSASIRAGVTVCGPGRGVMLLLADLPEITAEDLNTVLQAARQDPEAIWRATSEGGVPGHPVLVPAALVPELATLTGDTGARDLLRRHADLVRLVALPGAHATTDLDTPEDWAAWRAANPGR